MVKAKYISMAGELVFADCVIYSYPKIPSDIPRVYENQVVWETRDGRIMCDASDIIVINLSTSTKIPKSAKGFKCVRIAANGIVYENPFVVLNPYEAFGLPKILGNEEPIGLINSDGRFLTTKEAFCFYHLDNVNRTHRV